MMNTIFNTVNVDCSCLLCIAADSDPHAKNVDQR